jgi:hypothetical protein
MLSLDERISSAGANKDGYNKKVSPLYDYSQYVYQLVS